MKNGKWRSSSSYMWCFGTLYGTQTHFSESLNSSHWACTRDKHGFELTQAELQLDDRSYHLDLFLFRVCSTSLLHSHTQIWPRLPSHSYPFGTVPLLQTWKWVLCGRPYSSYHLVPKTNALHQVLRASFRRINIYAVFWCSIQLIGWVSTSAKWS